MRKSYLHWYFLVALAVAAPVHAAEPTTPAAGPRLTEAGVVAAVLQDHPALAAVRERLRAAELAATRFSGLPAPALRMTVTEIDPSMLTMQPTIMLVAELPIPLGGQREAAALAVKKGAAPLAIDAETSQADLEFGARTAFATYRGVEAKQLAIMANIRVAQEALQAMARVMAAGQSVGLNRITRLQVEIATLEVEREAQLAARPGAQARLNALMGQPLSAPLAEPDLALPDEPLPDMVEVHDHPVLRRVRLQIEAARARSRAETAASRPTLMPGAGLMSMHDMPIGFMVTLGIGAPDWLAGKRAQARAGEGLADAAALELTAAAKVRTLTVALVAARSQLQQIEARRRGLHERVLPALRKVVRADLPALISGSGSVIEVIESTRRLREVELQLVDLDTQWLQARAAWLQALRAETGAMEGGSAAPSPGGAGATMSSMSSMGM